MIDRTEGADAAAADAIAPFPPNPLRSAERTTTGGAADGDAADADGAADVDLEKGEGGRPPVRPPILLLLWWAID